MIYRLWMVVKRLGHLNNLWLMMILILWMLVNRLSHLDNLWLLVMILMLRCIHDTGVSVTMLPWWALGLMRFDPVIMNGNLVRRLMIITWCVRICRFVPTRICRFVPTRICRFPTILDHWWFPNWLYRWGLPTIVPTCHWITIRWL